MSEARRARGLALEQAAQETRISRRFLEALEAEEFDELPAPVYVRGFLRSYANYLGIDPQPLIDDLAQRESGAGYAARPGASGFYQPPPPSVPRPAASSNPFRARQPEPAARMPANPAPPAPLPPPVAEWSPERQDNLIEDAAVASPSAGYYDDWPTPSREDRTAGLLLERETDYGSNAANRGGVALLGLAALGIGVLAVAFILMGGGGSGGNRISPGGESAGASGSTTPGSVIGVGTPTPRAAITLTTGGTPTAPTETATATATGTSTSAAEDQATPTTTATPASTATSRATATATARPAATATPTTAPATATPVPTATPTTAPPTPTATVVLHALGEECGADFDCGPAPYRVICSPGGPFIDRDRDFAAPDGWHTPDAATVNEAASVC